MSAAHNLAKPVEGILSPDGRLVQADELLLRLHLRCGGAEGGPLAVPQLARICKLSRQLGMNLSRPAQTADDEHDIRMWVETRLSSQNKDGDLLLFITDWQESVIRENAGMQSARDRDFAMLEGLGEIQTDASLRIASIRLPGVEIAREDYIGKSFLNLFSHKNKADAAKFTESIAERQPIKRQDIVLDDSDKSFTLTGHPLINSVGNYSGYRFTAEVSHGIPSGDNNPDGSGAPLVSSNLFGSQLGPVIRQPLGKIIANAETIGSKLEGPLRGEYAGYAKDIASAGRHLMDLVKDMSDLEVIERDSFTVAADDVDLVDLAHRAAGLLAVKAADHQMRIDTPDESEKCPATGEFRRVLQILVNLIGNAIRYSPDGSVIKVKAWSEDEAAYISVTDQGDGIAEADQPRIFEKFERLGRSGDGGSGLGLFISSRLATAMQGSLKVQSEEGQGAIFTLQIPARKVSD